METRSQHYMFVALLAGAFVLMGIVFLPFLASIVIAIVLSVLFRPLHRWVARMVAKGNERSSFASVLTLVIIAVLVVTPLTFLVFRLYSESQDLYVSLTEESQRAKIVDALNTALFSISHRLFDVTPTFSFDSFNVTTYIQNIFEWSFSNLNTIFESAAKIGLNMFIALIALYYMLRDGTALKRNIIAFSPLLDVHEEQIFAKLEQAVHSVVSGSLIVSVIQGTLMGLGFWFFGIPNPVLWGSVAMIAALIPGIGTALVLVPGVIFLFVEVGHWNAVGLLVWGMLAVGLIDNVLSGFLMNRKVRIHPFLVLLSVLGGLSFFGPIGFILGPLILAFLFALIDIYKKNRQAEIALEAKQL